jgi:hypothetical protein
MSRGKSSRRNLGRAQWSFRLERRLCVTRRSASSPLAERVLGAAEAARRHAREGEPAKPEAGAPPQTRPGLA